MEMLALRTLWSECFGNEDDWIDTFLGTAFDSAHISTLNRQGRLAAALCWMDCFCGGRKLAYLYAIATATEYRHQGLCRELMALTHRRLAELEYAGAILVPAGGDLRQMYAKMGYVNFGGVREIAALAGQARSLRQITAEAYAALRRVYLPEGGVIQENGAVEYLAAGAELYSGQDFLLAMSKSFGLELLGNPEAAPGILGALGLTSGTFRAPGEEPFAMYRSMTKDEWIPGYFGLAFE